jgi:hypothetical protein
MWAKAESHPPLIIVVEPVGHRGRYCGTIGGWLIVSASAQPFLDVARLLVGERDKAYEERNFAIYATARIRDKAIRRNSTKMPITSMACKGDLAGRGSVFSVPLDLIGHASFKFDSPPLDRAVVRTIFKKKLPDIKSERGER